MRLKVESYYVDIGLNQLIVIFMMARLYMLIKVFGRFSRYQTNRSVQLCYKYYVEPSLSFAVRAFLKQHPYILTMVCLIAIISVFGYAVQTFEIGYPTTNSYISNFNPYWNVIITFTTVGYGDIFPSTHFGRLMAVMSMFFGQFIISLILIAMSISAEFTLEERKAFKNLKDIDYFLKRAELASQIISVYTLMTFCNLQVKQDAMNRNNDDDNDDNDDGKRDRGDKSDRSDRRQKNDRKDRSSDKKDRVEKKDKHEKTGSKVFKFTRFDKIGNLRAYQKLKIQYNMLVRQFKGLNS